jgi:protein-S-isoprenylcysteine O-methyltransferase Ste14
VKTVVRLAVMSLVGLVLFGALVCVPAGTVHYWQGWVFLAVFAVSTWMPSLYLLRTNPAALVRRMRAGPAAETRTAQKLISGFAFSALAALVALSVLDHRFGWSAVPAAVSVIGDVLVAVGLGIALLVVIQNSYAAANVAVEAGQSVVSTGLYGLVRHPMYVGTIIMMVGIPLALGSYWALLILIPGVIVLAMRILDEETLLGQQLTGYRDYMRRVRYRLVPHVW